MKLDPKAIVRGGYDKVSFAYRNGDATPSFDYAARVEHACRGLQPATRFLDLGCGCGQPVSAVLAKRGRVTGVDLSPVQIERARAAIPNANFVVGDMCEVHFPRGSFDAVFAFYSIIHVPVEKQLSLLRSVRAWLRPGGRLVATLGANAWTGTERDWLGVSGATMYWSQADAATYRTWLAETGYVILEEEFVTEGTGGHQLFIAQALEMGARGGPAAG